MRVIALVSFYDEPPANLIAALASLKEAGVDEVVAVDGAYALYPNGTASSHVNQHAAIDLTCRELGMGCTLYVPSRTWQGNEIEKRTFLFRLSLSVADEGDWFWVFDADQVVKDVPADYKARLEATEHDVAELEVFDTVAARAKQPDWPERFVMRSFFKAQKIRVVTNHITYMAEDGRLLWGYVTDEKPLAPALDLTDLVVEHRPDARPHERQVAKLGYYAERDNAKVERDKCSRCGDQAVQLVATKWRWSDLGPVAEWAEACEPCAKRLEKVGRMELTRMGVNPDGVSIENRNGRIPA
jgi:hypothetical protein